VGGPGDVVRIDDLGAPVFSADITALFGAMADMADACVIEPGALRDAASEQTGLDDFGDDLLDEPLEVLTRAMRDEAGFSDAGVLAMHTQLVQVLVNRLRLVDLLRRHPEIHDVDVARPIVIVGLPRTGTTHLHNAMAADPALRALPYWEANEPVPVPGDVTDEDPGGVAARRARTQVGLDVLHQAAPYIDRMHEMTVDHVHEEIGLLATGISTMFWETLAIMPSWRDWYCSTDQTPWYRWLRTCLQALSWQRGGGRGGEGGQRWVLKSPQHLEQLGPLLATFGDATVVVTHRDPVQVTASFATMVTYLMRLQLERVDPRITGPYWAERIERLLNACLGDRDQLPTERSLDVRLPELLADQEGTIARVYERAGQPFDGASRDAVRGYLTSHERDRHGRVRYELSPFGLDGTVLRERLRAYSTRFAVPDEALPD
jgi:hypothetical protein